MCMLAGLTACGGNESSVQSGASDSFRVGYGILYMNPTPGNTSFCTEVSNGYWQITLVDGTTSKKFLALNKEVMEQVMATEHTKVLFNQSNVIVGVTE